jgi:hypothetical protein
MRLKSKKTLGSMHSSEEDCHTTLSMEVESSNSDPPLRLSLSRIKFPASETFSGCLEGIFTVRETTSRTKISIQLGSEHHVRTGTPPARVGTRYFKRL